jgi:hypothetical protein
MIGLEEMWFLVRNEVQYDVFHSTAKRYFLTLSTRMIILVRHGSRD